ncbi:MAG: hypothetical protein JW883_13440 [Deltaproteobacteria bacterium]|nr:hypothetical protein [Deltaproteobacteria bacterium]
MKRKRGRQRTITGIVVEEDWDENGNVIRVAIKTRDYLEYVVEHNKKGKELLAFVDNKLRFTGTVRERLDGDMIITVESYEPIKDNDEDEEDEYKEDYA